MSGRLQKGKTTRLSEPAAVRVDARGRIVVPVAHREALDLKAGDTLLLRREGDELRIVTRATMIKSTQQRLAKLVPPSVSVADELIADRRREARRERGDDN